MNRAALYQGLSARALMSPDMSRWLGSAVTATTPSAIRTQIGRLSAVAARDPAIAQEALGLQRALLQAVNDNMGAAIRSPATRAAAEQDEDVRREQP